MRFYQRNASEKTSLMDHLLSFLSPPPSLNPSNDSNDKINNSSIAVADTEETLVQKHVLSSHLNQCQRNVDVYLVHPSQKHFIRIADPVLPLADILRNQVIVEFPTFCIVPANYNLQLSYGTFIKVESMLQL